MSRVARRQIGKDLQRPEWPPGVVIGGVDTHKHVHVAAACDALGRVLATAEFATTTVGFKALRAWPIPAGRVRAEPRSGDERKASPAGLTGASSRCSRRTRRAPRPVETPGPCCPERVPRLVIHLSGRQHGVMATSIEIETQGEHQYVVRLRDDEEVSETWFNITPAVLDQVRVDGEDEEWVVRRTAEFLVARQSVADFPDIVELEDVIATYDDFIEFMTR
jgi:hypothetical protein